MSRDVLDRLDQDKPFAYTTVMTVLDNLVPANAPHSFDARGGRVALALIDATGPRGRALQRAAHQLTDTDLARAPVNLAVPPTDSSPEHVLAWTDSVVPQLGPRLAEAARHAGLSPDRLTHEFSRQVGLPFRRFVLWLRLNRAGISSPPRC